MSFLPALDAMANVLRTVPGVLQVQDSSIGAIGEYPQIIPFPALGPFTPFQQRDRNRQVTWAGRHRLLWVWVAQPPDDATGSIQAVQALEAMAQAILGGFFRDQLGGTVLAIYGLTPVGYGWTDEDNDRHFSAGLEVEFSVTYAVESGKILP